MESATISAFGARNRAYLPVTCALRQAFTLIEVLTSMVILSLLVVILSQVLGHVGGIWLHGQAQLEQNDTGRAVLEFITKDLQAVQLPANRSAQNSLQLVVNPSSVTKYRNRDAIFWQAPIATVESRGDLAEIGYFVQWDETKPANPRSRLCRFFVNPADPANAQNWYRIYTAPNNWISDSVIAGIAPADQANDYQGLFSENVIGLWITCLDPAGQPITQGADGADLSQGYDSRLGYRYVTSSGSAITVSGCALPSAIDLSFVMLDSRSANRVTAALEQAVKNLANRSDIRDADAFVEKAQSDLTFAAIQSGLRPCKTRIYLQNSK